MPGSPKSQIASDLMVLKPTQNHLQTVTAVDQSMTQTDIVDDYTDHKVLEADEVSTTDY